MTAVCVSITHFKREKTVGKSDSSYSPFSLNTHTHSTSPDSHVNSTVGLGARRIHRVNCVPSQQVAFQVTREKHNYTVNLWTAGTGFSPHCLTAGAPQPCPSEGRNKCPCAPRPAAHDGRSPEEDRKCHPPTADVDQCVPPFRDFSQPLPSVGPFGHLRKSVDS